MVSLESPPPRPLPPGARTAVFLAGSGAPDEINGVRPIRARGHWWSTVPVTAGDDLGVTTIPVGAAPQPHPRGDGIAVCMATYEPDEALFRAQIESLRAQTAAFTCFVSDDASVNGVVERVIDGDERFVVSRSEVRQGFYRNFERALELVPAQAELVALCDQDDVWRPEKLEVLASALGDAVLAFSDQRLTAPGGQVLAETLWRGRAVNHTDLLSMLVANAITGAACLFRRSLLDVLLPFPETPGLQFHDHWLAVSALAAGRVTYVDRPLYDYVQHGGAVFGEVSTGERTAPRRSRRAAYFLGYCAREVAAQTLLARGAEHPDLRTFADAQRSPRALARLARAPRRATTLGTERELVEGVLWKLAAERGLARDVAFPDPLAFEQRALREWRSGLARP